MEKEITNDIEDAKINYSPVYRISNEVFTKKASDVLKVPIERVQVHRNIMSGSTWGKLSVYIFKENDEEKAYYRLNNGAVVYEHLNPNIYEFEKELLVKAGIYTLDK